MKKQFKKIKRLEYIIRNGNLEDFEQDIKEYHATRTKLRGEQKVDYMFQKKKYIKDSYCIDERTFNKNLLVYFNRLQNGRGHI